MRIMGLLKSIVLVGVVFTSNASWSQSSTSEDEEELPTLADIAAFAEYSGIKISPDGAHLAVRKQHEGKNALIILQTDTLEPVHLQGFTGRDEVDGFWWISDERILFSKRFYTAGQERALSAGEYFAMNVDGSQYVYAFGYQNVGGGSKSRDCGLDYRGSAGFIAALNDRDVLMSYQPWLQGGLPELYRVNTKSCKARRIARGKYPTSKLYLDADNEPRINIGISEDYEQVIAYRHPDSDGWTAFGSKFSTEVKDVWFDESGVAFFKAGAPGDAGKYGIYKVDLDSGDYKRVYHGKDAEVWTVHFDGEGKETGFIYGVTQYKHWPEFVPLGEPTYRTNLRSALQGVFPDQTVSITSVTDDENLFVLRVSAPHNTSSYYLWDKKLQKLRLLLHSNSRLEGKQLAEMQGIEFKARDGMPIQAYFTTPVGATPPYPTIVMVHGGPHGPRDTWDFQRDVQALATNGYGVLQVNYRGSGGFGEAFERAGYREWGRKIQQDIVDGTRWAVGEGLIDPDRLGIYGGSFGGYSALMAPIVEPGLYKAAIGFVGVYDLELMKKEGNVPDRLRYGPAYLDRVLPVTEEEMRAQSPQWNAEKLELPIMIVHGREDRQADYGQALAMRNALDKANKSYDWIIKRGEGHGFFNPENREEMYTLMLEFFDRHLLNKTDAVVSN